MYETPTCNLSSGAAAHRSCRFDQTCQRVRRFNLQLIWHNSSGLMELRDNTALCCSRILTLNMTGRKIKSIQCHGIYRWLMTFLMSGRRQTSRQLSLGECGNSFPLAAMTSNDWCRRALINGVLVYFHQNVPQLTTCLWHLGNRLWQKYWHMESAGNGATTRDINRLWGALPTGFGLLRQ